MAVDPQMMQQMMGQIGQPPMDPSQAGPPQGGPPMDPAMMEQLLASLGGGGQPPAQTAPPPPGDWLATAINSVHQGMVAEKDPQVVSMIGAILDKLTTVQAKLMPGQGQGGSPQGG